MTCVDFSRVSPSLLDQSAAQNEFGDGAVVSLPWQA